MAERLSLEEAVREAAEANIRYYSALGQLTVDYLRALQGIASGLQLPTRLGQMRPPPPTWEREPPARPRSAGGAGQPTLPALVLEAEAGGTAFGVFLVENDLEQAVSAPVAASAFVDETGAQVPAQLTFDPEVVTLEPGQQMLVRVSATIGEELDAERSYRGELTIPGLTATPVPIVLRRRSSAAASG